MSRAASAGKGVRRSVEFLDEREAKSRNGHAHETPQDGGAGTETTPSRGSSPSAQRPQRTSSFGAVDEPFQQPEAFDIASSSKERERKSGIGASVFLNAQPNHSLNCNRKHHISQHEAFLLEQQRTSLLGKPLIFKSHRRDAKYRRLQCKIYNFLERPRGMPAASYHILVFGMVLGCLALSVFSTMPDYQELAVEMLFYLETVLVFWFSVEYGFRIWSSGCRSRYQGAMGRLRFASSPFCIIDVVVIGASLMVLCLGTVGQVFAASAIRALRFFQILRMVRIDRRGGTWKLLGSVVWAHRQELITTLYIGFLALIFASFLMYICEKNTNEKFATFADALWWGVITLCTVGYGDKVPTTWTGRIVASGCALLGISFFALPAGILGSGFALKVQQQQRQKHLVRRRGPAASLIQCMWRLYASDEQSRSVATWKVHLQPTPSQPTPFKQTFNQSFVSRFSRKSFRSQSSRRRSDIQNLHRHVVGITAAEAPTATTVPAGTGCATPATVNSASSVANKDGMLQLQLPFAASRDRHSRASSLIGGIVEGISQQAFVAGAPVASAVWQLSFTENLGRDHARLSMDSAGIGSNLSLAANNQSSSSAHLASLSAQIDDESAVAVYELDQLTSTHKTLIRFLRRLKYLVARRKFKEALKPYDVKDVIEQYSAGHVDLLARVKIIQAKLELITGKCDSATAAAGVDVTSNEANRITLSHRIVKIERQMEDVDTKLDYLIDLFLNKQSNNAFVTDQAVFPQNNQADNCEFKANTRTSDIHCTPPKDDPGNAEWLFKATQLLRSQYPGSLRQTSVAKTNGVSQTMTERQTSRVYCRHSSLPPNSGSDSEARHANQGESSNAVVSVRIGRRSRRLSSSEENVGQAKSAHLSAKLGEAKVPRIILPFTKDSAKCTDVESSVSDTQRESGRRLTRSSEKTRPHSASRGPSVSNVSAVPCITTTVIPPTPPQLTRRRSTTAPPSERTSARNSDEDVSAECETQKTVAGIWPIGGEEAPNKSLSNQSMSP